MIKARKTIQKNIKKRKTRKHKKRGGTIKEELLANTEKAKLLLKEKQERIQSIEEKIHTLTLAATKGANLTQKEDAEKQLPQVTEELNEAKLKAEKALQEVKIAEAAEIAESKKSEKITKNSGNGSGGGSTISNPTVNPEVGAAEERPVGAAELLVGTERASLGGVKELDSAEGPINDDKEIVMAITSFQELTDKTEQITSGIKTKLGNQRLPELKESLKSVYENFKASFSNILKEKTTDNELNEEEIKVVTKIIIERLRKSLT